MKKNRQKLDHLSRDYVNTQHKKTEKIRKQLQKRDPNVQKILN